MDASTLTSYRISCKTEPSFELQWKKLFIQLSIRQKPDGAIEIQNLTMS